MDNLFARLSCNKSFQTLIAFAEHVSEGVAFVDLNGTIYFVNTSWARMHSFAAPNELIGKNISLFHTPAQVKAGVLPLMEKVRQVGHFEGPLEHIRSNGTAFKTLTKAVALNSAGSKTFGLAIFATDITERSQLAQLEHVNKQLQNQLAQMCKMGQSSAQNSAPAQEWNEEPMPIREIPPFDPKKLKALADLAKRLAGKSGITLGSPVTSH
jgi:PAS domain S-box-containing protein